MHTQVICVYLLHDVLIYILFAGLASLREQLFYLCLGQRHAFLSLVLAATIKV